jgi:hypothetical protein
MIELGYVISFDPDLSDTVLRLVRFLGNVDETKILAPLIMRELENNLSWDIKVTGSASPCEIRPSAAHCFLQFSKGLWMDCDQVFLKPDG